MLAFLATIIRSKTGSVTPLVYFALTLKVNGTPDDAIQQIKDKNYVLKLRGKLGEQVKYTGKILAVGISYDKKTKNHFCKVEVLDEKGD